MYAAFAESPVGKFRGRQSVENQFDNRANTRGTQKIGIHFGIMRLVRVLAGVKYNDIGELPCLCPAKLAALPGFDVRQI